jgi:hypothetical protein
MNNYEDAEKNLQQIIDTVDDAEAEAYPPWTLGEKVQCLWIRHQALQQLAEITSNKE